MKIFKIGIKKKDLSGIPKREQILLFQVGTMLNEINVLQKTTLLCSDKGLTEIEKKGQIAQFFIFHGILVGKLWECWEFLRKTFFKSTLALEYEELLSDEGKSSLKKLKQFFGKNQWISKVRNRFAFHYDPGELLKQLELMRDDEPFEIFLAEAQGNSLFYCSTILHLSAILGKIDVSDEIGAIQKYFSDTLEVSGNFIQFFNHFLGVIAAKYIHVDIEEFEIPDPPSVTSLHIPFVIGR